MRYKDKKDQALFDKLTDELTDLYITAEVTNGKIAWRARRLNALYHRTRCRKVPGCSGELNHQGCHNT